MQRFSFVQTFLRNFNLKHTIAHTETLEDCNSGFNAKGGSTVELRSFLAVLHFNYTRLLKAPFIWSLLIETTPPQVTLAEETFHLFLCKTQPTVYKRIANPSGGETTRVGELSRLGR